MKIAMLSDIHGNAVALEQVLEEINKRNPDQLLILGDIAFRGPEPKRSVQLVQETKAKVIKGNADLWATRGVQKGEVPEQALEMMQLEQRWCQEQLGQKEMEYLEKLPDEIQLPLSADQILYAYHATPSNCFDVVLPDTKQQELEERMMVKDNALITAYAHIHLPFVRFFKGRCIINSGSVGLSFDGLPKASYIWIEVEEGRLSTSIERVSYDIEKVCRQYKEVDYPNQTLMQHVVRHAVSPFTLPKV